MHTPRIGTRGSQLATTQTGHVADMLRSHGLDTQLEIITTPGDLSQAPVERIGVGVFTQALREAMAEGRCDIAVHSFKDLPTARDPRFHLVVPPREDARDALVARDGLTLDTLPQGATVGTSAPRRVGQLRRLRPDLDIRPLRGNIDSRMRRVSDGDLDAVILAAAGLRRIGLEPECVLDPEVFLPAPAQGALAVECRVEDAELVAALDAIACPEATACALAEREVLAILEAGCTAPIAAHATVDGDVMRLVGGIFGETVRRHEATGTDPRALAAEVAGALRGE
ncbi:hydroxymethylbilane synthase [Corynebacterium sp. 13CS0277]|uniref:hydroxymethylbilane synthase n=1 Tax=Corynebacterium sp. 13CS0277 TaxID=2071994 RepID=UPI000D044C90|nr:hydroxymethylbilane synthase [Corynebacterium sp. 13CS0277]PRQ10678.1 hydroxymethylbilane synthase [Corynebacterium sp. 13CS0277]